MYNADCRIIAAEEQRVDSDTLQTEHVESQRPEVRCSLRQLSEREEIAALGRVAIGAWRCRLHSTLPIQAGWRLLARIDGESEWREYVVRRPSRGLHWNLLVERV